MASALPESIQVPTVATALSERYSILFPLGSGGTATVYLGVMTGPSEFRRNVAIKQLNARFAAEEALAGLLDEEARIIGHLSHTNLVPIVDFVRDDNGRFVVMDYVHGLSLSQLLRKARAADQSVPVAVAVGIICGVLEGLGAAHSAVTAAGKSLGIVHRDIAPDNVLIGQDGCPRIVDFGIARADGRMVVTETGVVKGKFRYMSPEQAVGEPTQSSDVFSAAIILWEMLTGRALYHGPHDAAVLNQVLSMPIPRVTEFTKVSAELDAICARGLARAEHARYADALTFARELARACAPASFSEIAEWASPLAKDELDERLRRLADGEHQLAHQSSIRLATRVPSLSPPESENMESLAPSTQPAIREYNIAAVRPRGRRYLAFSAAMLGLSIALVLAPRSALPVRVIQQVRGRMIESGAAEARLLETTIRPANMAQRSMVSPLPTVAATSNLATNPSVASHAGVQERPLAAVGAVVIPDGSAVRSAGSSTAFNRSPGSPRVLLYGRVQRAPGNRADAFGTAKPQSVPPARETAAPVSRPNCAVPYDVDASGVRVYRRECF